MERNDRLSYIADLATLSDRLGALFVQDLHGEPVAVMDHVRLIASEQLEVPPLRVLQVAAARCVVEEVYSYIAAMTGTAGDPDEVEASLFEAVELFDELSDDEFRAEPGVAEHLGLVDLARAFKAAHERLAGCEEKGGAEGERLFREVSDAYLGMAQFVTERLAAASRAERASRVGNA